MREDMELTPTEARALARRLMREQAGLGLRVATLFVLLLIGLPLINVFMPDFARMETGGFTLAWLILGVMFFPVTWILSWYYVKESDRIEARHTAEIAAGEPMSDRGGSR